MSTIPALPTVRISQRASTSCSECSRSDKEIPCANCKKRGKAHLCHVVPNVRPKDAAKLRGSFSTGSPLLPVGTPGPPPPTALPTVDARGNPPIARQAPTTLEGLSLLAFAEVEELRSTVDSLRTKISGLETLLVTAFGKMKEDPEQVRATEAALRQQNQHLSTQNISPSAPLLPTPLPSVHGLPYPPSQPSYRDPSGDIFVHSQPPLPPPHHTHAATASSPSLSPFQSGASASNATFSLPPINVAPSHYDFGGGEYGQRQNGHAGPSSEILSGAAETAEGDGAESGEDNLREEEVAASLSLEFMALGRHRALNGSQNSAAHVTPNYHEHAPLPPSHVFDPSSHPSHPSADFPDIASLASVLPPYGETQTILNHAIDWMGWYHATVHGPTFRREVQEFWAKEEEKRLEEVNPAFLALMFAQLCCGIKHMATEHLNSLFKTEEEARNLAKKFLDASLACLYRSHFLENHQFHAVQTITVLVIGCQDGAFSNLFPMLLSVGISLALDLGLHRLPSEEAWQASVAGQPLEFRANSLIQYETKKRVFWALLVQDWYNIPYRRTTMVQATQVTTPLPSNASDEDLMTGLLVNRPPSDCTTVSLLLIWIQVARIIQQVFQHIDENPNPTYSYVLELDRQLKSLLENAPVWMTADVPAPNLPPNASWMRSTFNISSNHKVLTIHRAFFRRYEQSRRRAIDASRAVLRSSAFVADSRMWTVPYHITGAASVVCLDLFQRGSPPEVLHEERREVLTAFSTLRFLSSFSAIAARGAALIENLLSEESRLPPIPSSLETADEHPTKKRRLNGVDSHLTTPPSPLPSGSRASLSNLLVSAEDDTLSPSGLVFGRSTSPSSHFDVSAVSSAYTNGGEGGEGAPGGLLGGPNGLGLVDDLPPSFVSAFIETGFDLPDTGMGTSASWLDAVGE
ncbi:hypothetical protein JCM8547_006557 [Rhodosporidiobolus lusitaniae]